MLTVMLGLVEGGSPDVEALVMLLEEGKGVITGTGVVAKVVLVCAVGVMEV